VLAVALQEEGVRHWQWLLRLEPPAVFGSYRSRPAVARPSNEGRQSNATLRISGSSTLSALQNLPPSRER
jgi:hypothetical protein